MIQVNYIAEMEAFIVYASHNGLSANERTLWYALFHLANERAKAAGWPDGFIPVSNKILLSLVPFSENTLPGVRNRLAQRGLIEYSKGKRKEANPCYRMRYFRASYPQNVDKPVDKPVDKQGGADCAKLSTCYTPNSGGKKDGINDSKNSGINNGINADIRINHTERETGTKQNEEDIRTTRTDSCARAGRKRRPWADPPEEQTALQQLRMMEKGEAFAMTYGSGRELAEALIESDRFPASLVLEAVKRTMERHRRDPLDSPAHYTERVLEDWTRRGIRTRESLVQHMSGFYAAQD